MVSIFTPENLKATGLHENFGNGCAVCGKKISGGKFWGKVDCLENNTNFLSWWKYYHLSNKLDQY